MESRKPLPRPTEAELAILRELWRLGPATVRQVHEALQQDAGYTTTLKLLQIMTEKGLVRRNEDQRSHIYEAVAAQQDVQKRLVRELLDRAFGGSAKALVVQALSARPASAQEMAEIRALLDQHTAATQRGPKIKRAGKEGDA